MFVFLYTVYFTLLIKMHFHERLMCLYKKKNKQLMRNALGKVRTVTSDTATNAHHSKRFPKLSKNYKNQNSQQNQNQSQKKTNEREQITNGTDINHKY